MVKIHSFDVFDTCLIRRCAVPTDVFAEVAHRIGATRGAGNWKQDFVAARITAEQRARTVGEEEVTLSEIWQQLVQMVPGLNIEAGVALEMEVEREWIRPNPAMLTRVNQRRSEGHRIVFTSDTSLPQEFIRERLAAYGFLQPGDGLYVSSEQRATKRTGTLFARLLATEGVSARQVLHIGDDPGRDGRVPKRAGLRTEFVTETRLQGAEVALVRHVGDSQSALHRLAGAMREARLAADGATEPRAAEVVAGFVGPFILAFASWVLERTKADGIRRLYFLSRDGYLLYRACRLLTGEDGALDCRYLEVSRQSLLLPSLEAVSPEGMPWLRRSTETPKLGHLLAKLELALADAGPRLQQLAGGAGEDRVLHSDDDWKLFWEGLRDTEVQRRVLAKRDERRALALSYFRQAGLGDPVDYAIVDLGWFLTGQLALSTLLRRGGLCLPTKGYYLGLDISRYGPAEAGAAESLFYRAPPDLATPLGMETELLFVRATTLLEHLVGCAPSGTVLSYRQEEGGQITPRFAPVTDRTCDVYRAIVANCLGFVTENRNLAIGLGDRMTARTALMNLITELTLRAPRQWVEYLAKVEAATDQNNRDAQSLAAPYRILQLCSGVSDALRGRRTVSVLRHWEHGSHLRSGLIAQILFGLMSWTYRTLKRRRMLRP